MTTEEIIADLRQNGLTSASIYTRMERAANRLEELQRELTEAIRERNKTVADLIKQRDETIASARQEPSRLEIVVRIMEGWAANPSMESLTDEPISRPIDAALEITDALIAAAKEGK